MRKIVVLNCVGLTPRLLPLAPRLSAVARRGWMASMPEVLPAVTCTAQATLLTGKLPSEHGIVANGWLFRETQEVRFWQQSNALIQAEPLYSTAKRRAAERGKEFRCAKLFWWYNQGADVAFSVTPKPWYGIDGNKAFGIAGTPDELPAELERQHGKFPFPAFWGPTAGRRSTEWIALASSTVLHEKQPELTLVYLPHLDYDPQRFGPSGTDMAKCLKELDDACAPLLDAAEAIGAEVWIVSEYGHCDVSKPVYINRILNTIKLLKIRPGPFGDQLDLFGSAAFAVCDHQLAHVYIPNPKLVPHVIEALAKADGVGRVYVGEARGEIGLDHPRSGEIIVLAKPGYWFAYPFWDEHRPAPDYARAVAIHAKPGYDPCELFWDPKLFAPKLRAARRLVQKKLGFRTIFDVVPLDASLVRGSHGLAAAEAQDRPLLAGHGANPGASVAMTAVRDLLLSRLGLVD
jgi:predicted AlkP superfamily pyrophosphatase or phosphodiesterase